MLVDDGVDLVEPAVGLVVEECRLHVEHHGWEFDHGLLRPAFHPLHGAFLVEGWVALAVQVEAGVGEVHADDHVEVGLDALGKVLEHAALELEKIQVVII